MKAQSAIEYLILISILLFMLIPILYYSNYQSTSVLNLNDAQDAVQTLAKTADYVYSLGPGTSSIALITIPRGASKSIVREKEVILNMSAYGEVVGISKANLTGNFSYSPGTYNIKVTALDNGLVKIG